MSMLTHRLEQPVRSPVARGVFPSQAHAATLRRICLRALAVLSMGSVLTLLIALKTAAYFWRFPL